MKINVYVIDFEIPPRVKKWGLRIGVPAIALVAGGVAYAGGLAGAGPAGDYQDGHALTTAMLDANFNYLQGEIAALQNEIGGDGGAQTLQARIAAVHSAIIGPTGSVTSSSPSSWIATVNHSSTGTYGISFAAGTFSTTPACVAMADTGNQISPAFEMYDVFATGGTLAAEAVAAGATTPTGVDTAIFLICIGS